MQPKLLGVHIPRSRSVCISFCALLLIVALFSPGCADKVTEIQVGQVVTTEIPATNYDLSYFFVDTIYAHFWEPLHRSVVPTVDEGMAENRITAIDVWTSNSTAIRPFDPSYVEASAYSYLPARPEALPVSTIDTGSIAGNLQPTQYFIGHFRKLDRGRDYTFDNPNQDYAGYIILNTPLHPNQALAVTYTIDGSGHPKRYGSTNDNDTAEGGLLLLKLIRPARESLPYVEPAWDLQIKCVYSTGIPNPRIDDFDVRVARVDSNGHLSESIHGKSLLNVLGLDRFGQGLARVPDDRFDFIPGLSLERERGDLIFPTLRPFDSGIVEYFRNQSPPRQVGDSLLFPELYDTIGNAVQNSVHNRYTIRIRQAVLY